MQNEHRSVSAYPSEPVLCDTDLEGYAFPRLGNLLTNTGYLITIPFARAYLLAFDRTGCAPVPCNDMRAILAHSGTSLGHPWPPHGGGWHGVVVTGGVSPLRTPLPPTQATPEPPPSKREARGVVRQERYPIFFLSVIPRERSDRGNPLWCAIAPVCSGIATSG